MFLQGKGIPFLYMFYKYIVINLLHMIYLFILSDMVYYKVVLKHLNALAAGVPTTHKCLDLSALMAEYIHMKLIAPATNESERECIHKALSVLITLYKVTGRVVNYFNHYKS